MKKKKHTQQQIISIQGEGDSNDLRPVWTLTTEEFRRLLRQELGVENAPDIQLDDTQKSKYIYGLNGIKKEFGVGHNTAQRLKDTILRDAVLQAGPGCKVIVDLEMARRLYRDYKEQEGLL